MRQEDWVHLSQADKPDAETSGYLASPALVNEQEVSFCLNCQRDGFGLTFTCYRLSPVLTDYD